MGHRQKGAVENRKGEREDRRSERKKKAVTIRRLEKTDPKRGELDRRKKNTEE